MNTEWVLGGVLLLLGAAILKTMQSKGSFQTLLMGFTFCWSTVVAIHVWQPLTAVLGRAGLEDVANGAQVALAAYWAGALIAALPGLVLLFQLRSYRTTFPPLVDGALLWGTALLTTAWCACLLLMSLQLWAPAATNDAAETTRAAHIRTVLTRTPPRLYIRLAARFGPTTRTGRREHLPAAVRELLLQ